MRRSALASYLSRARAGLMTVAPLDLGIALGAVAASAAELALVPTEVPDGADAAISLAAAASLALRRVVPIAVLSTVVAAILGLSELGFEGERITLFLTALLAAFTVGSELRPPRTYLGPALTVGVFGVYVVGGSESGLDLAYVSILYWGAWAAGRVVGARGQRLEEMTNEAAELERARAERERSAVAAERARIARELHDIVSHSISVVVLQSQAVRRRLRPEQESEIADLEGIEATARQAMAETRRLFGVLRPAGEPAALGPQPGLDQLPGLIDQARARGVAVALHVHGKRVALSPGVDLAAYRVVQEALTNISKHTHAAATSVSIAYGERELEIAVENEGNGRPAVPDPDGGLGLIGMRERTDLYGGSFEAGPRPGGGFAVRVRLPFRSGDR